MDVILHLGAHRTASTSFQAYMRGNADQLAAHGIGFWGPWRTRNGLFNGVIPTPGRISDERQYRLASGRIALACAKTAKSGMRQLVVSDENMLGAPRQNLRADCLYPDAAPRVANYLSAFGGGVERIVLSIRSPDYYWASCLAFAVARGHALPDAARLTALSQSRRGWRAVICDIASVAPAVPILVMTHEEFGGMPERRLWLMTGQRILPPMTHARQWLNRSPDLDHLRRSLRDRAAPTPETTVTLPEGQGRWMPFNKHQQAAMREHYADDLFWLRAGADGLATLAEETGHHIGQAGPNPPPNELTRGRQDDKQTGRMVSNR